MTLVDQVMKKVRRQDFLPTGIKLLAGQDAPLAIGYRQTNSQPSTVRQMLGWLDVQPGHKVLDVGSGSGWTSALLSELVGPSGSVDAVELVPELVEFGRRNCLRYGTTNVTFHQAGATFGLPDRTAYDRILVSASAENLPDELVDQLAAPGKLVIPIVDTIYEIEKDAAGDIAQVLHPGYRFVPLISGM